MTPKSEMKKSGVSETIKIRMSKSEIKVKLISFLNDRGIFHYELTPRKQGKEENME
jgi:hypothetical protein